MSDDTSMIERVALAIEGAYRNDDDSREAMRRMARAAIEEMRVPTDAMVDAYVREGHGKTVGDVARAGWQAMIDAALNQREPG